MGQNTISFAFPGFRPKENMISEITAKLEELNLCKDDTVVLDLLSNVVFMGTDDSGLPTEATRAEDGSYHIVDSLTIAPPSLTKKIIRGCSGLAKVLKGTGTVLISPAPRYVYSKCCENIEYIENFEAAVSGIRAAVEAAVARTATGEPVIMVEEAAVAAMAAGVAAGEVVESPVEDGR
jgi:hypothetical protein